MVTTLDPHQQFIKANFEKHARLIAFEASKRASLPVTQEKIEHLCYLSIMTMLSTAFYKNKLIVKNNPIWDNLEKGS